MSRGIGRTQQAILAALDTKEPSTTAELAAATGTDHRQVRAAVAALEDRDLLVVRRNRVLGWRTGKRSWTNKNDGSQHQYDSISTPIPGTVVWSLAAWEAGIVKEERMVGDKPDGWRDHADPARQRLRAAETA